MTAYKDKLVGFGVRRRKLLFSIAGVFVAYTLLGFFLAPWLINKTAIETAREAFNVELKIEKVAVNPFVLSLSIDGLQMDDPNGDAVARLQEFYANFQLSSLFRWAVTFAEIRFDAPELFLVRDAAGTLNVAFLSANNTSAEVDPVDEEASLMPLIIQNFSVNDASTHWSDAVPQDPVATTFGPVNVQVLDLNTLPQRAGQQDVVITTETAGTISWSGSLQLNPLRSAGRASIEGSHFGLMSAYIRDVAGFEVVRGNADLNLDYSIETMDDGQIQASVDGLQLALNEVLLRTFGVAAADGTDNDRDVLELLSLRIDGGKIRFPERTATFDSVSIDDGVLSVYRYADGDLNILHGGATAAEPIPESPAAEDTPTQTEWLISLDSFDISRMALALTDDSVSPQSELGIEDLSVKISALDNVPETRFPIEFSMRTGGGGSITSNGTFGALPNPGADLELKVEGISLALLHPYIKSLADVNLDSGALGMTVKLHTGPEEALLLNGDVAITNFLITETDEGSRLGSWDTFALNQVELSLGKEKLDVSEIRIDRPYGDIFIAEDGSVNLGRVAPGVQTVEETVEEDGKAEVQQDTVALDNETRGTGESPLDVTIGRVVINDAAADFADFSLPLPFDAKIAALNGSLTTIASSSTEPSEVNLEGKVDEFGLVQISGTVTPLEVALNTDIKLRFQNVAMPKFSAYTVPFAGREIASGKLDLDLGYAVQEGELVGENKVVLRDFELGEKVDHPGAASLPLGLAVALLKGPDGSIDLDVPVRGNIDDPNFRYGRVVGKALVNLIVKIVASPFALLGKLVGAEADELEYIAFQDGRADLTPPEQEKVAKLAEALGMRPELTLQIHGVIDKKADGLAIRTMRFDELVAANVGGPSSEDGGDAMYAEQRGEEIEALFKASLVAEEQETVLAEMRSRYTNSVPSEDGSSTVETFDELAYSSELRRQLIDAQEVDESEFSALAAARAENVRVAIAAANPDLERQMIVADSKVVERGTDELVQMKVVLSAGENADAAASTSGSEFESSAPAPAPAT
jgi:uncharacterized protein involved in outer membrane biogenesis